jgi:hypothetical protein
MTRMMSAREISDAGRASQKPPSGPDRLQELARYLLSAGELIGGDVTGARRGEFDDSAQCVVGPG